MPELSTVWFVLLGAFFVGYALLDGFDLGAGTVHLYVARDDSERRAVLNAIGPVWDGNEVWLVTAAAALFAAFPLVYATVFSGFYAAVVLILGALILRGISIEFRSKESPRWWRTFWDILFCAASALAVFLFGVALGNILRGLSLDPDGVYRGGLAGLLNPFSIAVGVLSLGLAAQQGAAWLVLKTEGAVQARARRAELAAVILVVAASIGATGIALADAKRVFDNFGTPLAWAGPVLAGHALGYLARSIWKRWDVRGFLCSGLAIIGMAITAGTALYPNLVPAVDSMRSLTVDNSSSSSTTLSAMLVIALIGMPIVLAYTAFIYWQFKGKVKLDEASY
jgi:cytochrome d ubiquinol oxidase subunit II